MNEDAMIKTLVRVEREQALLRQGKGGVGFNMGMWFEEGEQTDQMDNVCDTTACLAGHAAMTAGWVPLTNSQCVNPETGGYSTWSGAGAEVLDLTHDESEQLFYRNDLNAVYSWVAYHMGVDEQVLRDKVMGEVG